MCGKYRPHDSNLKHEKNYISCHQLSTVRFVKGSTAFCRADKNVLYFVFLLFSFSTPDELQWQYDDNEALTYLLTPWCRVLLEKLTASQLVKKFAAFYGTRRFITATNELPPPIPILSQLDPVHTNTSHFLKIHLNIILPSTTGCLQQYLSLRFPHQTIKLSLSKYRIIFFVM